MQAEGPPEALAAGIKLVLADARLEARPVIDLHSGTWTATMLLRHPGARRLVATLGLPERIGLPGLGDWLSDGSLSLVAHLAGSARPDCGGKLRSYRGDIAGLRHAGTR